MLETVFSINKLSTGGSQQQRKLPFEYEKRCLLMWEEHCVECSPPYCYHHCLNYQKRADNRCVRLLGGIQKISETSGSFPYGFICEFRKWAKLEAQYVSHPVGDRAYLFAEKANAFLSRFFLGVANLTRKLFPNYGPYSRFTRYKNYALSHWVIKNEPFDVLYIDCRLCQKEQVQLLVQINNTDKILFSQIFTLKEGDNQISIDISHIQPNQAGTYIFITPMNEDTNTRIVFSWLDLFKLKKQEAEQPADKVKVVVWDLDNTLWKGTIVNDSNVIVNKEAVSVIKELDKRGILNTISSKNDFQPAFDKLVEFGLQDYFLCPAINWGQKSQNIKEIAKRLNLGVNSFAFIDDNIREREEVKTALPMVRVYDEQNLQSLLERDEFDVPVSETSQKRRLSYMQEVSRQQFAENYSDDYEAFLRHLEMELTVFPVSKDNERRCYELVSRSNQLNLSTNRYSEVEFRQLLSRDDVLAYAFSCKDKFGDYGIIAFMSIQQERNSGRILDFVISCRVAKKKVESAIITSLHEVLRPYHINRLQALLVKTKKNGPLAEVFHELPFDVVSENEHQTIYELSDLEHIPDEGILKILNHSDV